MFFSFQLSNIAVKYDMDINYFTHKFFVREIVYIHTVATYAGVNNVNTKKFSAVPV